MGSENWVTMKDMKSMKKSALPRLRISAGDAREVIEAATAIVSCVEEILGICREQAASGREQVSKQ